MGKLFLSKPPDKNWALQYEGSTTKIRGEILSEMGRGGLLQEAQGFLQSDNPEYLMVEFWHGDDDVILNQSLAFAEKYGYELE
ncbi:hypothetical protein LCGC14_0998650 [marine sediment metagenome]|uniref:Uncharacterized protein n=1 Tax=marine sediment metagenome TaxID=412755 RepID=A0A0F9N8E2_9ZZZZ